MMLSRRAAIPCLFVLSLLGCAGETRRPGDGRAEVSVTRDEAARVDRAEQEAATLASDAHRRCVLWRRVEREATTEQRGLREYAKERVTQACSPKVEQTFELAEAAVAAAEKEPTLASVRSAVVAVERFRQTSLPGDRTLADLATRMVAAYRRVPDAEVTCDDRKSVAWLDWKANDSTSARDALTSAAVRPCLGVTETRAFLQAAASTKAKGEKSECGQAVAIAADVWPRATTSEEQVALLDGVVECSDAYSLRRNLAFVPRDVLMDYQALVRAREAKFQRYQQQRAAVEANRDAVEKCESMCSTMYADQGGVCTDSCRGDTVCFRNCQRLGAECRRQCR
jgi:hypothetical protein